MEFLKINQIKTQDCLSSQLENSSAEYFCVCLDIFDGFYWNSVTFVISLTVLLKYSIISVYMVGDFSIVSNYWLTTYKILVKIHIQLITKALKEIK